MDTYSTFKTKIPQIRKRVESGEPKDIVYLDYYEEGNEVHLRRLLANIPDHKLRHKYNWINLSILSLMLFTLILEFIGLLVDFKWSDLFSFSISVLIFFKVYQFDGSIYFPATCWFLLGIVKYWKDWESFHREPESLFFLYTLSCIFLVLSIMLLIIRNKVFYYFNWFLPSKDEQGRIIFQ